MKLNYARDYSIYLYNTVDNYERINTFYLSNEDVNNMLNELRSKNSYLYKNYKDKYKYYIVVDKIYLTLYKKYLVI